MQAVRMPAELYMQAVRMPAVLYTQVLLPVPYKQSVQKLPAALVLPDMSSPVNLTVSSVPVVLPVLIPPLQCKQTELQAEPAVPAPYKQAVQVLPAVRMPEDNNYRSHHNNRPAYHRSHPAVPENICYLPRLYNYLPYRNIRHSHP